MSMMRTMQRNLERTALGRECRRAAGKPVSTSKNKIAKKWQRAQLKRSRYARLVVGLLCRATGAHEPALHLVCKIETKFQESARLGLLASMPEYVRFSDFDAKIPASKEGT